MRRVVLSALLVGAGCNQVFGLDELEPGGGSLEHHTLRLDATRLTASEAVDTAPEVKRIRYLVRDGQSATGYTAVETQRVDASASADLPAGAPHLIEVAIADEPPLFIATTATAFRYYARIYGRAGITPVPAGVSLPLAVTARQPFVATDMLTLDTYGVWTRTDTAATGGPTPGSTMMNWDVPWSAEIARPRGATVGLLTAEDRIVVLRRAPLVDGAWIAADGASVTGFVQNESNRAALTLESLGRKETRADSVEDLVGRVMQLDPRATSCVDRLSARSVLWPATGNTAGTLLGLAPGVSAGETFSWGDFEIPNSEVVLSTSVACTVSLGQATVAIQGDFVVPSSRGVNNDFGVALPVPFVRGFQVNGVGVAADTAITAVGPTIGPIELVWLEESGVAPADYVRVELVSVAAMTVTTELTVVTTDTEVTLPADAIDRSKTYALIVTAYRGYPNVDAGDMAPVGPFGATISVSGQFRFE